MRAIRDPAQLPSAKVGGRRVHRNTPPRQSCRIADPPHQGEGKELTAERSDTCRLPTASLRAGYSLLEVLLTVTLIALVGAIAAPSLLGQIERRETRLALTALQTGMTELRYEAVLAAAPVEIAPEGISARFNDVPDGWRVTADGPLHISAGGLCDGETVLTLTSPDQRLWHRRVTAPHCELEHG